MKTKNNTRETANNQVRSFILRGSAILCGLALISLTVNAQSLWAKFSGYNGYGKLTETTASNEVLYASNTTTTPAESNSSAVAFALETEMEEELELENWMTNSLYFTANNNFTEAEAEEALRVESWMLNCEYFGNASTSESVAIEIERPLEIESWMIEGEYFNTLEVSDIEEPALRVESWMLENKYFDNTIDTTENSENESSELEAWMTNDQLWRF